MLFHFLTAPTSFCPRIFAFSIGFKSSSSSTRAFPPTPLYGKCFSITTFILSERAKSASCWSTGITLSPPVTAINPRVCRRERALLLGVSFL